MDQRLIMFDLSNLCIRFSVATLSIACLRGPLLFSAFLVSSYTRCSLFCFWWKLSFRDMVSLSRGYGFSIGLSRPWWSSTLWVTGTCRIRLPLCHLSFHWFPGEETLAFKDGPRTRRNIIPLEREERMCILKCLRKARYVIIACHFCGKFHSCPQKEGRVVSTVLGTLHKVDISFVRFVYFISVVLCIILLFHTVTKFGLLPQSKHCRNKVAE